MAISPDVLATALQDLKPKFEELFLKGHPILAYVVDRGVEQHKMQGPYREFTVLKGGPGTGTGVRYGSELLRSQRKNQGVRGNEFCYRYIYHFDVPLKDLAEASGKQDLARIIDAYPEISVADARQRFNRQVARGSASSGQDPDGAGASGFTTLNGSQTYDPQGTARTGVFQYSTTQTATVFGLPMGDAAVSPTPGWKHQYSHISSFSLEGAKTARKLMTRASQEGMTLEGQGINLILSDEDSYHNYIETLDDRIIEIDKSNYKVAEYINREGVKFGNADWWWEPDIDITDTTSFSNANAQLGVAYMLNTAKWEMLLMQNNSDKAGGALFDIGQPIPIPDQDAIQYRIVTNLNLACNSLRHQALMTGGAQE